MRQHRSNLLLAISGMLLLLCSLSALSIQSVALAQPPRPTLTPTAQPPTPRPTSRPKPEATATPEPTATALPIATTEPTAAAQPTPVTPAQMPQTGEPSGTPWIALVVGMGLIAAGAGLLRTIRRAR